MKIKVRAKRARALWAAEAAPALEPPTARASRASCARGWAQREQLSPPALGGAVRVARAVTGEQVGSGLRERDLQAPGPREGFARRPVRGVSVGPEPAAGALGTECPRRTARLGLAPPPTENPPFGNLTAPLAALRNLLVLDPTLQLYLLGFVFPNFFRPTLP